MFFAIEYNTDENIARSPCYIEKIAEEKLNIFQIFITVQNFTRTKCVTGVTLATKTSALVLLRILILGN
jgi:hypothetical protein